MSLLLVDLKEQGLAFNAFSLSPYHLFIFSLSTSPFSVKGVSHKGFYPHL